MLVNQAPSRKISCARLKEQIASTECFSSVKLDARMRHKFFPLEMAKRVLSSSKKNT